MISRALRTSVALLAALATITCTDGDAPAGPTAGLAAALHLAPRVQRAGNASVTSAAAVNRIRLVARSVVTNQVLGSEDVSVDPGGESWELSLEVGLPDDEPVEVVIDIELFEGGQVAFSGRAGPLLVTPGSASEVRRVQVFRGPLDNLAVTGLTLEDVGEVTEGIERSVAATVDTDDPAASPQLFWSSSDEEVATVDASGVVTALLPGTTTVVARAGAHADSIDVTVAPRPEELVLDATSATLESLDAVAEIGAVVLDPRGDPIPGIAFEWSVADPAVAESLGDGRFRALANGSTGFTATAPGLGLEASGTLTVRQEVAGLDPSADALSFVALGATATVESIVLDANDHEVSDAIIEWSTSDAGVATIDDSGLVTAVGPGTATLTVRAFTPGPSPGPGVSGTAGGAQQDTTTASVTVTVEDRVASVEVSPSFVTLLTLEADTIFEARALDDAGAEVPGARIEWSSGDPSVATVDASGRVGPVGIGTTGIVASAGSVSGSGSVKVWVPNIAVTRYDVLPGGVEKDTIEGGEGVAVAVELTNTGDRTAGESRLDLRVVEPGEPTRVLAGTSLFQPALAPGETVALTTTLGGTLLIDVAPGADGPSATVDFGSITADAIQILALADAPDYVPETDETDNDALSRTLHFPEAGGRTRVWTGELSTDWSTDGNWSPAGVPTPQDTAVIPDSLGVYPVLSSNVSVAGLLLEPAGASLDVGTFDITVSGDVRGGNTITGSGTVVMTGSSVLLRGELPSLSVQGSVALDGSAGVAGNAVVDGGHLDMGFGSMTVLGNFETRNGGTLAMTSSDQFLDVQGDAIFDGGDTSGLLTWGLLRVQGNFTVTSATAFVATQDHRVYVNGSAPQTIRFAPGAGGATGSHFATVTLADQTDVTLEGTVHADRTLRVGGTSDFGALVRSNAATTPVVTAGALDLSFVDVDNVAFHASTTDPAAPLTLNGVVFRNMDTDAVQLSVEHPGTATSISTDIRPMSLTSGVDTGLYIRLRDTAADGENIFLLNGYVPPSSAEFTDEDPGTNDGATISWGT